MQIPTRVARERLQRVVADAIAVNVALGLAFLIRFIAFTWDRSGDQTSSELLHRSWSSYLASGPALTIICLVVFALSGFYTYGRAYRGRYKSLVVTQAVSLAYLIYGAMSYLLLDVTSWFPRPVWLLGWGLTAALVLTMRLWAKAWRSTVFTEARMHHDPAPTHIRNVLVIGGAGFAGSVLIRHLLHEGYHVTVLDALMFGDHGIRDLYEDPRFSLIKGDLRNIEAVIGSLRYTDAVVHLGGLVGDPACAVDEDLTTDINLAATRLVAEAARGFGVQRFIFTSSCSVYGATDEWLDERSTLNPISLYARTKAESETILLELETDSFAPVILRLGTLFGISHRPRFDIVVNKLAAQAVQERAIEITGGDQWRPFVHVADAAEAMIACLKAPTGDVSGETFNVGSNANNHTISQVGSFIREHVPDVVVLERPGNGSQANYKVSCSKIESRLGLTATRSVSEGIAEIKDAIEQGLISAHDADGFDNHKTLSDPATIAYYRQETLTPLYSNGGGNGSGSDVEAERP